MKLNRPLIAIGILSLLYLVAAAVKFISWPAEVGHIATTIVAVLIVHILDHWYFREEIRNEFVAMSDKIVADMRLQTEKELANLKTSIASSVDESRRALEKSLNSLLADQSESIAAMQKNAIRRVYSSRSSAAMRIAESLSEPTRVIRLMGVSLNDFFRGDNPQLRDAWVRLSDEIQASEIGDEVTEIRVMMINPRSFGAVLRSYAEGTQTGLTFVGRLLKDIEAALDNLVGLEEHSRERTVRFSCRLYNVAPTMFVCHVDKRCFVQHYHFWTQRRDATPMAVIEYENRPASKDVFPMHGEILAHFDVIWENATIPIDAYRNQKHIGIDDAAGRSGLVNLYNMRQEAGHRIQSLMLAFLNYKSPFEEKSRTPGISLQGISLKSFFSSGDLSDKMYEIIQAGEVEVRILFLDEEGEQARFRSYREYLLKPQDPQLEYQAFTDSLRQESTLSVNTRAAIEQLKAWIREFGKDENWICKVSARRYRSAPTSFVFQIGDRLLVEPYNYGKLGGRSSAPTTLGTDMPLLEFQLAVPAMFDDIEYQKEHMALRNPFQLVMDHFDFAFKTGIEIPLSRGVTVKSSSRVAGSGVA